VSDQIFWLFRGRLAQSCQPGRWDGRELGVAVRAWLEQARRMGIRSILCLLTPEELDRCYTRRGIDLLHCYREAGFTVFHCPVPPNRAQPVHPIEVDRLAKALNRLPSPWVLQCDTGVDRSAHAAAWLRCNHGDATFSQSPKPSPPAPMNSTLSHQPQARVLRTCLRRLRARITASKARRNSDEQRVERMELGKSRLEARMAQLRGQEHLSSIPLFGKPLGHPYENGVEMDEHRDAIVWYLVEDDGPLAEPLVDGDGIQLHQLVFRKVTRLSVTEEFQQYHRRQFRNRGYIPSQSLYEVRNSRMLKAMQNTERERLTHWVFFLDRRWVDVLAEDVAPHRDDVKRPHSHGNR